jgi:hypothetical protein
MCTFTMSYHFLFLPQFALHRRTNKFRIMTINCIYCAKFQMVFGLKHMKVFGINFKVSRCLHVCDVKCIQNKTSCSTCVVVPRSFLLGG